MPMISMIVLVTLRLFSLGVGIHLQSRRGQGTDLTAVDPATCVEAVVVEMRRIQSISTALRSAAVSKNAQIDFFTVAHGKLNADYVKEVVDKDKVLRSLRNQGKLRFRSLPFNDLGSNRTAAMQPPSPERHIMEDNLEHHDQYSRVLKSKNFWKEFTCDRILLMQSDSTLCSKSNFSLSGFYDYEYIGGRNPHVEGHLRYPDGRMHFNGGLSFRNRLGMLRCIDAATPWQLSTLAEDTFFSLCKELRQPSPGSAKKFAIDAGEYPLSAEFAPFGVHNPWKKFTTWIDMQWCGGAIQLAREYNPEMELFKERKWTEQNMAFPDPSWFLQ